MGILLTIAYASLCLFLIQRIKFFSIEGVSSKSLQFVFLLKIVAGIALSLIYTYYYTDRLYADCFKFYDDSKVIYDLFFTDKKTFFQFMLGFPHDNDVYTQYSNIMHNWWNKYNLYNENRTIIRLNVLMRFFSMGHYQVHNVFFCFFSFTGLIAIFKLFMRELKEFKRVIFIFIFLFPSILFWGSGVLKDGLIFFCTGLSLYFLDQLLTIGKKSFNLFASLLFLCLIFFVKVHVFFIFLPCYIAYGWSIQNNKQIMSKYLIVCGASIILLLLFPLLNPDINFLQYLANKQYEFIKLAHEAKAGSIINVNTLEPNITSVIKNSPVAFFNTLFRPHLLDSRSPLILLSALENTFIIVLTVFIFSSGIYNRRKISPMFYFSVFYVISSFILIGLIIPVMGAIVRYKVQALPYLFFILFFVVDREKVLKKFPFLNFLLK